MLDSDVEELRGKYLFYFAQICGMTPEVVDRTRLMDFATLILGIDDYLEALERASQDVDN